MSLNKITNRNNAQFSSKQSSSYPVKMLTIFTYTDGQKKRYNQITPKIYKAELWFLCMTHRLIVLYNCMKFHLNSFYSRQLTERTRYNQITPNISKAELLFLCMTHCLIVLYKCMKFQPNSFNCVQLTERTRNCIYLCYKGNNLKNS